MVKSIAMTISTENLFRPCQLGQSVDSLITCVGPRGFRDLGGGERLCIFRELRSTGSYTRGAGEQAHSFGDSGSPAKK